MHGRRVPTNKPPSKGARGGGGAGQGGASRPAGRGLGGGRAPPRPEADPPPGLGARRPAADRPRPPPLPVAPPRRLRAAEDRKSTRLNSSHANISYAVFCLKKKNL